MATGTEEIFVLKAPSAGIYSVNYMFTDYLGRTFNQTFALKVLEKPALNSFLAVPAALSVLR